MVGCFVFDGDNLIFNYGKSYLERVKDVVFFYEFEFFLCFGVFLLLDGFSVFGCICDSVLDVWGRCVIINCWFGYNSDDIDMV